MGSSASMLVIQPFEIGSHPRVPRGGVATIGVFDGVHIGHRAVIERTVESARSVGGPAILVTFSIHPDEIVSGRAPKQILSPEHRRLLFESFGLDVLLSISFDQKVRSIDAETFVDEVFIEALGVKGLVLGHDTAFGKDRGGTADRVRQWGKEKGFDVEVMGEIRLDGELVSSSKIRKRILEGDIDSASAMLGRPVSVLGQVVEGDQRGRRLGFPTANLKLGPNEAFPKEGVYAVYSEVRGKRYPAICNIGRRPTFRADEKPLTEVHLFDFEGDLYGAEMLVHFAARVRDEKRFEGEDSLQEQIEKDCQRARALLSADQPAP